MPPQRRRARASIRPPATERAAQVAEPAPAADPAVPAPVVPTRLLARLLEGDHQDGGPAAGAGGGADLAGRIGQRIGGGRPMPADLRSEVETGLGQQLGDVRLHTDGTAAQLATDVGAHAFTVGNDVFFNSGQFDPGSNRGYSVLVHELTHTLQQSAGSVAGTEVSPGLSVSHPGDRDEVAARTVADRLTVQRSTGHDHSAHDHGHDHDHGHGPLPIGGSSGSGGRATGIMALQRHSSWEHTLLGDTPPDRLSDATVSVEARGHLLSNLWARMMFFSQDPGGDPRSRFPDVRWVQLRGSGLWVSNGELNALADYLPDPAALESLSRDDMVPVLQKMRSGIRRAAGGNFGLRGDDMEGMATHWMEYVTQAGGEVKALDEATADLGTDRYSGLLARNACHFAPASWHRWAMYHEQAAEEAYAHFFSRSDTVPLGDVPVETAEHARQAILINGYGDHFLEDSFAAGHLVNKTLVMQWWVDYLNAKTIEIGDYQVVRRGSPDADVMARMGTAAAPGIAGRELYDRMPDGRTSDEDRESGRDVLDPQTAQERETREGRMAGSGVTGATEAEREANYQAFLRLLTNAQAQGAPGAAHDHFHALGLTVTNADGSWQMRVGGDDTLISKSGPVGAEAAARAAQLSRQAIDEILNTGSTSITTDLILATVPSYIVVDGRAEPVPLEQWQDEVLHELCFNEIFPDYYYSLKSAVIGAFGADMVDGGMSVDSGLSPAMR
jgi:hypothetical protein